MKRQSPIRASLATDPIPRHDVVAPALIPNRRNRRRRKWTAMAPSGALPARLRFGFSNALAQNPAESREFRGRLALRPRILWNDRPNGGGGSRERTRLWGQIPVQQGKYREFLRFETSRSESGPRFPCLYAVIATDSLRSVTGNLFRRAGKSRPVIPPPSYGDGASPSPLASQSRPGPSDE